MCVTIYCKLYLNYFIIIKYTYKILKERMHYIYSTIYRNNYVYNFVIYSLYPRVYMMCNIIIINVSLHVCMLHICILSI